MTVTFELESLGRRLSATAKVPLRSFRQVTKRNGTSLIPFATNPFVNDPSWTPYEISKALIVGITLFPLRVLIGAFSFVSLLPVIWLAGLGAPLQKNRGCYAHTSPHSAWRVFFSWLAVPFLRMLLWAFGIWNIKITDHRKDPSKKPAIIVVAPHFTFLDFMIISWAFPPLPSMVGQTMILKVPFFRWWGKACQGIFLDVKDPQSRASGKEAIEARTRPSWSGPPLMIWPEGRITNGEALINFKLGAFCPGQPVQPVLLRFPWTHYNPSWIGKNKNIWWAIRMMLQFVNHCELELLEVYEPSEEEVSDPKTYARNVRQLMADELIIPTTEHSYDDAFLSEASFIRDAASPDFEVGKATGMLDITMGEIKDWLRTFRQIDQTGSGSISADQFVSCIRSGSPDHEYSEQALMRLFAFFDQDDSGRIEYREFVQSVALFSGKCSLESRAKLAFLIYDVEATGHVRRDQLASALENGFAAQTHSLGQMVLAGDAPSQDIGFDEFCRLVERQPELLEVAFEKLQTRLTQAGLPMRGSV